jgi:hypothetical protein
MPCDSIVLNRVELPRMNPTLAERAIKAIDGWRFYSARMFYAEGYSFQVGPDGRLASDAPVDVLGRIADALKRSYSAQVVLYTAKRNGWAIKQTGAFAYEVTK